MSAVCFWTLIRSLLTALFAWPVCWRLERGLRGGTHHAALMLLLALPFLMPELLLGYLIAPLVAGLPWRSELALNAILFLRSVPVGVIALRATPPSLLSPAALHLRKLSCRSWQDRWELWRCYLHGPIRRALPALGLMFLIAFQEFDAAAMLGAVSWTDRLFVEHATGLSLAESWRLLLLPLAVQIVVLLTIVWSLAGLSRDEAASEYESPIRPGTIRFAWVYAAIACLIGVAWPLGLLSRDLVAGWKWLTTQPTAGKTLMREIGNAGLVGLVAGLAAWTFVRALLDRRTAWGWMMACSLPGLCGGLTASLALLWLSTRSVLHAASATPLFWVLALIVWLIPRALLLQLWLARQSEPAAMHLVELLRRSPRENQRRSARRWFWQWRIEPQVAACGLLCYWAYLDLTSAALLSPPGMASVVKRLYNFMHFGHSAAMSMEAAIVMLLPLALWGTMIALARAVACGDGTLLRSVAKGGRG